MIFNKFDKRISSEIITLAIPIIFSNLSRVVMGLTDMAMVSRLGAVALAATGMGSLFAIQFSDEDITDYRSMLRGNQELKKVLYTGLMNEGILMFAKVQGAVCSLTSETEIDTLVGSVRNVLQRIKG